MGSEMCIRDRLYIDQESSEERKLSSSSFVVWRFLSPESALPGSPRHEPAIVIKTETELVTVSADRRLEAALTDTIFVAFVFGIRCGERKFWELRRGALVDADSGATFADRSEIPDAGPKRFVHCLLRSGDRPLRCRVPDGEFLVVFYRAGTQLAIKKGRLQAIEPSAPRDIERWIAPIEVDKFAEDLTACARRQ